MDFVCPHCFSKQITKQGFDNTTGKQRYGCSSCRHKTVYPLQPDDVEIIHSNVKRRGPFPFVCNFS